MKKLVIALILLATMLLAACTNSNSGNTGVTGFIGGQKGLDISFYSGAPPETASDNNQQEFDIIVDISNGGEDAVETDEVYVKLSGFPPEAFGVGLASLKRNPEDRIEANMKNADGSLIASPVVSVSFPGFNYKDVEVANREFPIRAEVCYMYVTKAAAELCIKENFNSNKADDVCQVNAARSISTSGAPVQITALKQSTAGTDKTRFTFTLQNMDTGRVYKTDSACEQSTSNENKIFVKVSGLTSSGDNVKCVGLTGGTSDAGYVSLLPGEMRDVSCTVTVLNRNNRIEPFEIELTYAYWKYTDTKIIIQHTPE
jgi:hypothetical protein